MSEGIQFDEDKLNYGQKRYNSPGENQPAMIKWLIAKGFAKSPAMAQGILLVVAAICVIVGFIYIF